MVISFQKLKLYFSLSGYNLILLSSVFRVIVYTISFELDVLVFIVWSLVWIIGIVVFRVNCFCRLWILFWMCIFTHDLINQTFC